MSRDSFRQMGPCAQSVNQIVVIAGPTGAGKTQAAIALAHRMPAEIVCADSRTLYRGMDIGTAKPSPPDRAAVPHHLLEVADPDHIVTLAEYQQLARRAVGEIQRRGRLPILVGGTGLYIRAVVDRVAIPSVPPDWVLRARLEEEERTEGPGTLYRRLGEVDPATAARMHPRNIRRIIRALEVYQRTGITISAQQHQVRGGRWTPVESALPESDPGRLPPGRAVMVALTLDRDRLHERIDRRIDDQLARGLVDEVRALLDAGYARTLPALQGLGYKEIAAYLAGAVTLDEAVARFRRNTRRYAKRQGTWFRADPRYQWLDVGDDPPDAVAARIHAIMNNEGLLTGRH